MNLVAADSELTTLSFREMDFKGRLEYEQNLAGMIGTKLHMNWTLKKCILYKKNFYNCRVPGHSCSFLICLL